MNQPQTVKQVGYIGLGIMGGAMARNLVKAGFEVTVWNRSPGKTAGFVSVAESPADMAARQPQVICLNVTNTPDVEQVLFGLSGIIQSARPGLIVVDHSTISATATQRFAAELAKKQVEFLDAPVSGGDVGARQGTLSIMVGGTSTAFERCQPVLQAMGKSVVHLGPSGMGQVCKACNQIAVACSLLGVCEALALAQRSGLDLKKMIEVVSSGAAGSWQLANLGPKIAQGDFTPGFMIDLMLKDLALIAEAGRECRLPLSGTALAEAYFRSAQADGSGRLGTQAMAKTLEKLAAFRFAT